MKNQIILRENRHCDPDLTITANGHDSAATNNHNLHENDLPTNEDSNPDFENTDFSRKSDYFEVMSDLVEDEEVDNVDHCQYVTIPTNKNFSFASSNGNGSLVGGASGDSTEFYYEDELELKLEKPQKSHEEMVVTEEVTLPIKIQESESSESESESESETDSDSSSTSSSDVEPSVHIVEVTKSQCDGKYF